MTLIQLSNYLFLGSVALLILTLIIKGIGRRGMTGYNADPYSGSTTDLQLEHNHREVIQGQDTLMKNIFKSYFIWISLIGIVTSIVITL
ncbi:hypothetical protein EHS13_16745 [Paenibacillus psychroresistens]|uniref:DUF3899 domain-containing protein n=1 Tax=Paenibacillus psychroresistens TaxID=1778678 RepID=A0A6B8RLJ4_9BACL|nr:hypothetical protein [Paenibacillus psychroresistens]QGQ96413.1 hypothetical protein EHS13_16745 [Paenibacillus psychroresistens]